MQTTFVIKIFFSLKIHSFLFLKEALQIVLLVSFKPCLKAYRHFDTYTLYLLGGMFRTQKK